MRVVSQADSLSTSSRALLFPCAGTGPESCSLLSILVMVDLSLKILIYNQ